MMASTTLKQEKKGGTAGQSREEEKRTHSCKGLEQASQCPPPPLSSPSLPPSPVRSTAHQVPPSPVRSTAHQVPPSPVRSTAHQISPGARELSGPHDELPHGHLRRGRRHAAGGKHEPGELRQATLKDHLKRIQRAQGHRLRRRRRAQPAVVTLSHAAAAVLAAAVLAAAVLAAVLAAAFGRRAFRFNGLALLEPQRAEGGAAVGALVPDSNAKTINSVSSFCLQLWRRWVRPWSRRIRHGEATANGNGRRMGSCA